MVEEFWFIVGLVTAAFSLGLIAGTGIFIVGFFAGRSERDGTTIFKRRVKESEVAEDLPGDEEFFEEWSGSNRADSFVATEFPTDEELAKINAANEEGLI